MSDETLSQDPTIIEQRLSALAQRIYTTQRLDHIIEAYWNDYQDPVMVGRVMDKIYDEQNGLILQRRAIQAIAGNTTTAGVQGLLARGVSAIEMDQITRAWSKIDLGQPLEAMKPEHIQLFDRVVDRVATVMMMQPIPSSTPTV